jgi:carotenoid cleavage dioxygenase-like enzyme
MGRPFPDLPIFSNFEAPGRVEAEAVDLEVEGAIPSALDGTFFRVAPDPQWSPRLGTDIFFNGDGMVAAFRFRNGQVDFRTRYVRTQKFVAERQARKALFGAYRNPFTDDPSVAGKSRGTGNTNVVVHNRILLALKEDSPPVAMDPHSLETINNLYRFDGKMTSATFTAHPKKDPTSGELLGIGYAAKGETTPDIAYYVIDKDGKTVHEAWFKAPHSAMIHDFAATENFIVFPIMPLVSDLGRLKAGKPHFTWRPDLDQVYGVLPRRGSADDIRWFNAPNGFPGHIVNAYNEAGKVYLDMSVASDNVFTWFPDASGHAPPRGSVRGNFVRWTFDMSSNSSVPHSRPLTSLGGEFPHIDDRYAGHSHRHSFIAAVDPSKPYDEEKCGPRSPNGCFNAIGHFDVATGQAEAWFPGATSTVQEPVFAPRSATAPEGDGFVIALVNRLAEKRSDLVVLDAQRIDEGPIATVHVPIRLRTGLHGNWVPASEIPSSAACQFDVPQ